LQYQCILRNRDTTKAQYCNRREQALPIPSEDDMQINQLKKTSDINYQEFVEEYFEKKPVVITNKINHWPALKKWTPEYFKN
jgi:hypothetical protein